MARRKSSGWVTALILVLAICLWFAEQRLPLSGLVPRETHAPESTSYSRRTPSLESQGTYEIYHGCSLVPDKGNDGDSFKVRFPDGRVNLIRLYFVDTPETGFRKYRGGDTNHARIRHQAEALGGISAEDAVNIGRVAKTWVLATLAKQPFTISTRWDSPFNDRRYHGFVEIKENGTPRLLHELLVERGLCRIHTKGADLPDGTSMATHLQALREMESEARNSRVGAWGLR